VQSVFPIVVFAAVAFSVVMCVAFLLSRGSAYDQIGQGEFSRDSDLPGPFAAPAPDSPAGRAERELEVRQMLTARSERLVRMGRPALDVDAEVARLLAPSPLSDSQDAGLTEEVRQLVVARNERRARQGLESLDVEDEVARTLQELKP
jgi:hypothetical protein